jgi:ABC-type sugar transport system ATPase subunit
MTSLETPDAIRAENVAKSFGAVVALEDVSLRLRRGEVLGLVGDNGAGKSTLLKILTGFHRPDAGRLIVHGEEVQLRSVKHARELGIETVYQDLALVNELPVYKNMFLGRELVRRPFGLPLLRDRAMRAKTAEYLADVRVNVPSVTAAVGALSGGQRQAIAVARAAHSNASILLLDEPLAAMGAREAAAILDLINELRSRGDISMILIAHNYLQLFDICDRVNLLRHGRIVFDKRTEDTSVDELTALVASEYRLTRPAA